VTVPIPKPLDPDDYIDLTGKFQKVIDLLESVVDKDGPPVFVDFETNHLDAFADDFEILSVSLTVQEDEDEETYFVPLSMGGWTTQQLMEIELGLREFFLSKTPKVAQNLAFEDIAARMRLTNMHPVVGWEYDTMLGKHVLDERRKITNLDFQVLEYDGSMYSDEVNKKNMKATPLKKLGRYNCLDTRYLPLLMDEQQYEMSDGQWRAYQFFHDCLMDMIDAQVAGIRVDFDELAKFDAKVAVRIDTAKLKLDKNKLVKLFREKHGRDPASSGDDSIEVIYEIGGGEIITRTAKAKKPAMDDDTLQCVARATQSSSELSEYIDAIQSINAMGKLSGTYSANLRRLADKSGLIHPSFLLHVARTYRSSSAGPNFQNFPKRDEFGHQIRKCLCPPIGELFLEGDAKGSELVVNAMLANDRVMLDEIKQGFDLHRYWASQLFEKDESEITKKERSEAKSGFVFPKLYGSYYVSIAQAMGRPEELVREIEQKFDKRYRDTKKWQEEQCAYYMKHLRVETPLGFRRHAPLSKNQVINTSIQATSFHLLLAGLHKINRELKTTGRSVLCGQIHDSGYIATWEDSWEDTLDMCDELMSEIHFPKWQTMPMDIEWLSGSNMYEMEDVDIPF